jgi:hypothetical protein
VLCQLKLGLEALREAEDAFNQEYLLADQAAIIWDMSLSDDECYEDEYGVDYQM